MNENERNEMIEEYGRGYDLLTAALAEVPREAWDFKPAPNEWSIHEIVVHMADSETVGVYRLHKLIAEPGSSLTPYAEAKWSAALRYRTQDTDDALELFQVLRRRTHRLLKSIPDEVCTYSVIHPEWDEPYTLEKWLGIYVRHVSEHVDQLKQTYQGWKGQHR